MTSTPAERRIVALLSVAFAALATAFALLVPMFGNFDEQAHLDRARYAARHPTELPGPELRITHGSWGALEAVRGAPDPLGSTGRAQREGYRSFRDYPGGDQPDTAPCPGGLCQNIQYAHPPGWYLLAAPVTAVLEGQTFPRQVLALRLLNVALATPLVALAWATARSVWPASRRRPIAVAAAVALFGPLAYTASAVNNDGLLLLAMGAAIALAARLLRQGPAIGTAAALGLAVGVGLLTKVGMVLAAPAFGLAVLLAPGGWRRRLTAAVAFAVPALPGALWWFGQALDEGALSPESSELLRPATPGPWSDAGFLRYAVDRIPTLLDRVWGTYSEPVTFVPAPVQAVLGIAVVALAVGWLLARRWERPTAAGLRWWLVAAVPAALALGTIYASFDAYRRTGELRGLTPRYLYPSTPVLALGIVAAAAVLAARVVPARWQGRLLPAATALLAVGAVASVARAVQAAFDTSSWADIAERAGAVSPVGRPMLLVVPLAVGWGAALIAAALRMVRLSDER